ncbi:hypothetical protein AN958_12387 [Leucoagaricus sp. SymC.cos]|nr:hypothetical protein AN958_12387 [Leucoagaricus sp. SymC.cos]
MKEVTKQKRALNRKLTRLKHKYKTRFSKPHQKSYCNQLMQKGSYTEKTRAMARLLVKNGCARDKVGMMIQKIGQMFGVTTKNAMSRRTAGRVILEGYVASKVQLGYEIANTKGLTLSGDSTSHKNINYDARHITLQAPTYRANSPSIVPSPTVRMIGVDSSADQSSLASKNSWLEKLNDIGQVYTNSPLGQQSSAPTFSMPHVAKVLCGMNGDHASKEKRTAEHLREWKLETLNEERGNRRLEKLELSEVIWHLAEARQQKVVEIGGIGIWDNLSENERAQHELDLVRDLKQRFGKDEYNQLTPEKKRDVDLFIWTGCCMHKDQNSFAGGVKTISTFWDDRKFTPPVLLANKQNAVLLRNLVDPLDSARPLTEVELAAIAASARGGQKTAAISGALFRNKDSKKGQGDSYAYHFLEVCRARGIAFHGFPDTSNVRFGTYAQAASVLLVLRPEFLEFLELIKYKKQKIGFTNIELNLHNALQDIPTLTELACFVLYAQAVTHPYMRAVRGPGTESVNALDLGDLHHSVSTFVESIIHAPSLLVSATVDYSNATLDGQPWEDATAIDAVCKMLPNLPHLSELVVEFFCGALKTWKRFSAEFARGGLIDSLSAEERFRAFMPSTNDTNEGALGAFHVQIQKTPTLSQHQYNALTIFNRNNTQVFMDSILQQPEDLVYLQKEARNMDTRKLEKKRREELVAYSKQTAELRREKEIEKQAREAQNRQHIASIPLVSDLQQIPTLKLKELDEQLELLHALQLPALNIPSTKVARGKKADKQLLLESALKHLQGAYSPCDLADLISSTKASLLAAGNQRNAIVKGWEEIEAESLGEECD